MLAGRCLLEAGGRTSHETTVSRLFYYFYTNTFFKKTQFGLTIMFHMPVNVTSRLSKHNSNSNQFENHAVTKKPKFVSIRCDVFGDAPEI